MKYKFAMLLRVVLFVSRKDDVKSEFKIWVEFKFINVRCVLSHVRRKQTRLRFETCDSCK